MTYLVYLMFTRKGPFVARSCIRHDSPHQKDRHGAGQRGDADGARHRPVVIDALGHDVDLERALVISALWTWIEFVDERRDGD